MKFLLILVTVFTFTALIRGADAATLLGVRGFTQQNPNTVIELVSIDTNTLDLTVVGTIGRPFFGGGLVFDISSGELFMITGALPSGADLYSVDPNTGAPTLIGGLTPNETISGFAHDRLNDVFYATTRAGFFNLFTVDVTTGNLSQIGSDNDLGIQVTALTYDSLRDLLYGINADYELYSIDRTTGTVLSVLQAVNPGVQVDSLAYDSENDLIWAVNFFGNLYSYDPNGGYALTAHPTTLGRIDGLTLFDPDPEPEPVPSFHHLVLYGLMPALLLSAGVFALRRRV